MFVPRSHKIVRYLLFGFEVYISHWVTYHLKCGINVTTIQRRTDNIQWIFYYYTYFFIIWIKYPNYINTNFMIHIPNHVYQLDYCCMFTDKFKNSKRTFYLPSLYLINKTLLTFFLALSITISLENVIRSELPFD